MPPTMATATIIAIPMPTIYISVGGRLTAGTGDADGAELST
jgi:hypothetical protein